MSIRSLTQEDPIGLAGGVNLYGFAAGDPVNFSDPFGLCPPCVPFVETVPMMNAISQIGFEALPYEQKRAMVLGMAHRNAQLPILAGSFLTGGGEARLLYNGSRAALRGILRTSSVEGVSGMQGLKIMERIGERAMNNVSIVAGEGGSVTLNMTRVYEGGSTVTTSVMNRAGQELSLVRRSYNTAGDLIKETVLK